MQRFLGDDVTQVGVAGRSELEVEARKHVGMAAWREVEVARLPAHDPQRANLRAEAQNLGRLEQQYRGQAEKTPAMTPANGWWPV